MTTDIDWEKLTFSLTPAKTMYLAKTDQQGQWQKGQFLPYGDINMSPAAGVLNYGQGVFEGLKAHRTVSGEVVIFRLAEHGKRLANSAQRICMPTIPTEEFVTIITELVHQNHEYVPPYGLGSLYLRPLIYGSGAILGLAPATEYSLLIYASPVGNYFKQKDLTPIKLTVYENYHRAVPGGVGHVKYIGNYASVLYPSLQAKSQGFHGGIFLDPCNNKYIEESEGANIFCIKDGKLLTPQLAGTILPGITRASVLQLAQEALNMEVAETDISLDTLLSAEECFCTGTAAVITPIGTIQHKQQDFNFPIGEKTKNLYDLLIGIHRGLVADRYGWLDKIETVKA